MFWHVMRNDLRQHKGTAIITVLFVAAATMLVSLAAILAVNLTGALDTLTTKAKTPHFVQMHAGPVDEARLAAFASEQPEVEAYQLTPFLNIDGALIQLGSATLANNVQDNGLAMQGAQFDFLLDLQGNIIAPQRGELYVPVVYANDYDVAVGDAAIINGETFTIAGFLRDSQMNASLAASKRFLVHEADYAAMRDKGTEEYLITFRLHDTAQLTAFEAAYTNAQLEANGPTVTHTLFKLMNALSDGLMIAIILMMSALIVLIAFICIRFTLLSSIEDDYREIGVMKAIGMPLYTIKRLYMAKYVAMTALGSIVGIGLSLLVKERLLANIRATMGEAENGALALIVSVGGVATVFVLILAYIYRVMRRFAKISAVEAIRYGAAHEEVKQPKRFLLHRSQRVHTNVFLGIKDVLARKKLYVTMLAVIIVAAFLMIVPQNLHHTIASKSFTQYMGIGAYDMRIDLQQASDMSAEAAHIEATLAQDSDVVEHTAFTTKQYRVQSEDGTESYMKVELGDHAVFPITYAHGAAPTTPTEIALSSMQADELQKAVGDTVTLIVANKATTFTVSGIYSDITNGGKTAKGMWTDETAPSMWHVIVAKLKEPVHIAEKVALYNTQLPQARVSDVAAFVAQTFGSTIEAVSMAANVAIVVALSITLLITALFLQMLLAKDRSAIALLKSLGFTNRDVKVQYVTRTFVVLVLGIVIGTLLANTAGEALAGVLIGSFGAEAFTFSIHYGVAYVVCPLLLLAAVFAATIGGTAKAGHMHVSQHIKG